MTLAQRLITIALCALATMTSRFLPFLFWGGKKETPETVKYIGQVLPPAVFGMLLVYCLKNLNFLAASHGLPETAAVLLTVSVHVKKRNTLLSISLGTACYMLLLHLF